VAKDTVCLASPQFCANQPINSQKMSEEKKKKKVYRKPQSKTCFYCGSEKIERIDHGVVHILRCKTCGETQD
jgi:ribosomal protein L37AE/L43A